MTLLEVIITIITAMGGLEAAKWLYGIITNRKNDKKVNDAQGTSAEFGAIRDQLNFANEQNKELMSRLMDLQDLYNTLHSDYTDIKTQNALLETWKCEVRKCPNRIPPNGM